MSSRKHDDMNTKVESVAEDAVYGNVFMMIAHDIGRFSMSVIMHREVKRLFR